MMALVIPMPPSTNALYFNLPFGRGRGKTRAYRTYQRNAGLLINSQHPEHFKGEVAITISLPAKNRKDPDNTAKAILDVLVKCAVIEDDGPKFVKTLLITGTKAPGPDCIVTITEWKEGA